MVWPSATLTVRVSGVFDVAVDGRVGDRGRQARAAASDVAAQGSRRPRPAARRARCSRPSWPREADRLAATRGRPEGVAPLLAVASLYDEVPPGLVERIVRETADAKGTDPLVAAQAAYPGRAHGGRPAATASAPPSRHAAAAADGRDSRPPGFVTHFCGRRAVRRRPLELRRGSSRPSATRAARSGAPLRRQGARGLLALGRRRRAPGGALSRRAAAPRSADGGLRERRSSTRSRARRRRCGSARRGRSRSGSTARWPMRATWCAARRSIRTPSACGCAAAGTGS